MGAVAVLHPEAHLKSDNLLPTVMKSRRTIKFNPDDTNPPPGSDSRRRTPTRGILKKIDRKSEAVEVDRPAVMASKRLVMGQVKILKRGEALNESSTVLKDLNERKVSNGAASTSPEVLVPNRKVSEALISDQRVFHTKKFQKNRVEASKSEEDVTLSSTDRLGPDPELVKKNISELFAGSAIIESPPPSSVPLPGFFTNKFVTDMEADATTDLRRILGLSHL